MRWLVVSLLVAAGAAHAAPAITPSRLEVVGDACPAALVREHVRALVGSDPFVDDAHVVVRAELVADAAGVHARLEVRDGDEIRGTRELAAPRCETLADGLALAIAMVLREVEPATIEVIDDAPIGETREVEPMPDPAPSALSRFAMVGGAEVTDGRAFSGLVGARIHVVSALSVGVELSLRPSEAVPVGAGEAHVSRGGGTVAGCLHAAAFAGCTTVTAGWFHGTGDGLAMTRDAATPLVAVGARGVFEWPVTRWLAVRAHAELRALVTRTRFTVDDNVVWRSPEVETALGLAAVLPIP